MRPRIQEVVVDCDDPAKLARFWGTLLDTRFAQRHEGWWVVDADPLLMGFQHVPEPKSSPKNRLHLDVEADDMAAAIAAGARQLSAPEISDGDGYVVMADPEDNEFCLVVDNRGGWAANTRAALAATDVDSGI